MHLFDTIFNKPEFLTLKREKKKIAFPKSLLLIGKDELYLREFALACAVLILDDEPDLKSENCQKVLANAHPDVKHYPVKDKLMVADSEEIVEESFIKPIFSHSKIFIINNIDQSMESAQNKLLKVVEEPSNNVYLILTTTNPELVLPTIRSRCNKLELSRLSDQEIAAELKINDPLVVGLANGSLSRVSQFANMKNIQNLCNDCISVFVNMKSSKQVLAQSKTLATYKNFQLILEILGFILEDMIRLKCKKEARLKNFSQQLKSVEDDYTLRALCEIASLFNDVEKKLSYNVNPTLVIENLLLNILEVKYLCK